MSLVFASKQEKTLYYSRVHFPLRMRKVAMKQTQDVFMRQTVLLYIVFKK